MKTRTFANYESAERFTHAIMSREFRQNGGWVSTPEYIDGKWTVKYLDPTGRVARPLY